ncbi:MAG: hypothetical protein DWQ47_11640 [Acidobacteria bacterium]|nr:MAG: hypothetical protein DWQ32_14055 [Acidobacteriota bacterium]REJ98228.1 MAG: hypothetical protein DWQ38_16855 [Acidobacteriota bacterium]REK16972.1 MAG: hypothetical protein DWQ43_01900 [Acidobacteriota bacterium]REK42882.1 MAG: hypothetical protein DWQ47_11640 [Acidobacteriota bacterium]
MSKDSTFGTLTRREVVLGIGLFALLVPALLTVPYLFPPQGSLASAAAVAGYSNRVAHLTVAAFAFAAVLIFAICRWSGVFSDHAVETDPTEGPRPADSSRRYLVELVVVGLGMLLLYFPPFLSRYGPFIEDNYFMSVLHRINAGQIPYVDFEFLYGPLMVSLASFWTSAFGFSMVSYYSLLALMEVALFVSLLWLLQKYFPSQWTRYLVFIALSVLFFNTLMGVNWSGIRRFLPVLILIYFAKDPSSKKVLVSGSLMIGALLAFSHDYGTVGLAAALAMYGLNFLRGRFVESIGNGLAVLVISIVTWLMISYALLGGGIVAYLENSLDIINRFGAGEQGFPFYWTLNSVSVFGLLVFAAAVIGNGIGKKKETAVLAGDYLLFAGLAFALVGLKSGLNRADMWHLAWPMLVIVFAFVLPIPRSLFKLPRAANSFAIGLIGVLVCTYLLALAPTASFYLSGLARGSIDTVAGTERKQGLPTRAPSIEFEKSSPSQEVVELGNYLADESREHKPVVFYEEAWGLDKRIGVYNEVYPIDDFLLSDRRGIEIRVFLEKNPEAFVVMEKDAYERILNSNLREPESSSAANTPMKTVLSWTSTIHYQYVEIEDREKAKRWDRTVGAFAVQNRSKIAEFGELVLLGSLPGSRDQTPVTP